MDWWPSARQQTNQAPRSHVFLPCRDEECRSPNRTPAGGRVRRHAEVAGLFLVVCLAASPVCAVEPDEILKDATLEARARQISTQLRCLVCQNQSIDDSNAPLARDLRILVRERLIAGDSDEGVKRFLVQRYGEFVLLKPPFGVNTLLLWLAPLLVLFAAIAMLVRRVFGGAMSTAYPADAPLSPQEQARLAELMKPPGDGSHRKASDSRRQIR